MPRPVVVAPYLLKKNTTKPYQTHLVPRLGTDGTLHPGLQDQQQPKQMIYSTWKMHGTVPTYWLIWFKPTF